MGSYQLARTLIAIPSKETFFYQGRNWEVDFKTIQTSKSFLSLNPPNTFKNDYFRMIYHFYEHFE